MVRLCAYSSKEPKPNHAFTSTHEASTCSFQWRQVQPQVINLTSSLVAHLSLIPETNLSWHNPVLFQWSARVDTLCWQIGMILFVPVEKLVQQMENCIHENRGEHMLTCERLNKFLSHVFPPYTSLRRFKKNFFFFYLWLSVLEEISSQSHQWTSQPKSASSDSFLEEPQHVACLKSASCASTSLSDWERQVEGTLYWRGTARWTWQPSEMRLPFLSRDQWLKVGCRSCHDPCSASWRNRSGGK